MIRRGRLPPRQRETEGGSLTFRALDVDAAAVSGDRPVGERQAQTGPALLARPSLVDPVEALEDPLAMHERNPGTLIDNVDPAGRRIPGHDDADAAAGRAVFDRVVYDVHEALPKHQAIRVDEHRFASRDGQYLLFLLGENPQVGRHLPREGQEVHVLAMERHVAG